MRKDKLFGENKQYFDFIARLKSESQSKVHSREAAAFLKELALILSEAFDEYEPSDLPKYQARLDNIIKLANSEQSLQTPEFKDALRKSKEILDKKVKERFSTFKKISYLAGQSARTFGSVNAVVRDFVTLGDQSADIGRQWSRFKGSRPKIEADEAQRQHNIFTGASVVKPSQSSNDKLGLPAPSSSSMELIPVTDEKLIGTNNEQNKVLIKLIGVTKDTNTTIKQIKNLLATDFQKLDDNEDRTSLQKLEDREEGETPTMKMNTLQVTRSGENNYPVPAVIPKLPEDIGSGIGGAAKTTAEVGAGAYALSKLKNIGSAAKSIWSKGISAAEGIASKTGSVASKIGSKIGSASEAVIENAPKIASKIGPLAGEVGAAFATPAAIAGSGAILATDAAFSVNNAYGKNVKSGIQSVTGSLSKAKNGSLDYYKKLFKYDQLDGKSKFGALEQEDQNKAEKEALELLKQAAEDKMNLYKKAFANGEKFGDLSYKVNDTSQPQDAALADVEAAISQAEKYQEYLTARNKKNPSLTATAKFKYEGKTYKNPLYSDGELTSYKPSLLDSGSNNDSRSTTDMSLQSIKGKSNSDLMAEDTGSVKLDTDSKSNLDVKPTTEVETVKRAIAAAETGKVSDKDITDQSRFIRTRGGANSSAYGPLQITQSLAQGALKNGLLSSDQDLEEWTKHKFIPQGKKFLQSNYSDPKYGAGGVGDLHGEEDRKMYDKLANALVTDTVKKNKGDLMGTLGEWHYGQSAKNTLNSKDPKYAQRAMLQLQRDQIQMAAKSEAPQQTAMNTLSREQEAAKSQPIVVPVPIGGNNTQSQMGGGGPNIKSVGASPNGASEASFVLGLRMSVSGAA